MERDLPNTGSGPGERGERPGAPLRTGKPGAAPGSWASAHPWLETAAITSLGPLCGWLVHARDPFFVNGFPWMLVLPLVIGLHCGFRFALVSALALVLAALGYERISHEPLAALSIHYVLSMLLVGPLVGEYRDKWQRVLDQAQRREAELVRRSEELNRAYCLLRCSHAELEQRTAQSGPSLQIILEETRAELRAMGHGRGGDVLSHAGAPILELFGRHGHVQAASLHAAASHSPPVIHPEPVAELGTMPSVGIDHPMVADALAGGQVTGAGNASAPGDGPLACVPLVAAGGRIAGVVLVHAMPFLFLHKQHLELLAVLGAAVGDWLAEHAGSTAGDQTELARGPRLRRSSQNPVTAPTMEVQRI